MQSRKHTRMMPIMVPPPKIHTNPVDSSDLAELTLLANTIANSRSVASLAIKIPTTKKSKNSSHANKENYASGDVTTKRRSRSRGLKEDDEYQDRTISSRSDEDKALLQCYLEEISPYKHSGNEVEFVKKSESGLRSESNHDTSILQKKESGDGSKRNLSKDFSDIPMSSTKEKGEQGKKSRLHRGRIDKMHMDEGIGPKSKKDRIKVGREEVIVTRESTNQQLTANRPTNYLQMIQQDPAAPKLGKEPIRQLNEELSHEIKKGSPQQLRQQSLFEVKSIANLVKASKIPKTLEESLEDEQFEVDIKTTGKQEIIVKVEPKREGGGRSVRNQSLSRQKFSLYEDLQIIEAVEAFQVNYDVLDGDWPYQSEDTWRNKILPLLPEESSFKHERCHKTILKRYFQNLRFLTNKQINDIKQLAKKSKEQMKKQRCRFRKTDSGRTALLDIVELNIPIEQPPMISNFLKTQKTIDRKVVNKDLESSELDQRPIPDAVILRLDDSLTPEEIKSPKKSLIFRELEGSSLKKGTKDTLVRSYFLEDEEDVELINQARKKNKQNPDVEVNLYNSNHGNQGSHLDEAQTNSTPVQTKTPITSSANERYKVSIIKDSEEVLSWDISQSTFKRIEQTEEKNPHIFNRLKPFVAVASSTNNQEEARTRQQKNDIQNKQQMVIEEEEDEIVEIEPLQKSAIIIDEDSNINGKIPKEIVLDSPEREESVKERRRSTSGNTDSETKGLKRLAELTLKTLRGMWRYDDECLPASYVFGLKKCHKNFDYDPNYTLYVDGEAKRRYFFFKKEPKESKITSDKEMKWGKLGRYSAQSGIPLNEIIEIFNSVSCDCKDMEEYLRTRDERLVWTHGQDQDLLSNNDTGLRYLVKIKGPLRVKRRKQFLLGVM